MSRSKVLIVEDESIVSMDIRKCLPDHGYDASIARTGEGAFDEIRRSQPDVILMDIGLPEDYDGIETAERIHKSDKIPIIFITVHSDHATFNKAQQINGVFYSQAD